MTEQKKIVDPLLAARQSAQTVRTVYATVPDVIPLTPEQQFQLGEKHLKVETVRDKTIAYYYLREAEKEDHPGAMHLLAEMYRHGVKVEGMESLVVEVNKKKAFDYYLKAMRQGNSASGSQVGSMLFCGEGIVKDQEKAGDLMYEGAKMGHQSCFHYLKMNFKTPLAFLYIGACYRYGYGVSQDNKEALNWFRQVPHSNDSIGQSARKNIQEINDIMYKAIGHRW